MLIQLRLKNIALIEIIEINFEKGLNILTGDSGSGKSLILDSLNVLFGGTSIPLNQLIRLGKKDCLIEAAFFPSPDVKNWLINNGFKDTYSKLKIKRITFKKNKKILTKFFLNDFSINKKLLQELGLLLIDFAGQSDSFLFNSSEYRRLVIDDLGSKELKEIKLRIKNLWQKCENLKGLIQEKVDISRKKEESKLAEKEMYNILDKANLNSCYEVLELEKKEIKLANNSDINNSLQLVLNSFNSSNYEEPTVFSLINQSIKNLNKIAKFDSKIGEFFENLINIQSDIENLNLDISRYIGEIESSDISLEDVQKRLYFLKNLERTFLLDLQQLIKKRDQLKNHLEDKSQETEIKALEIELNNMEKDLNSLFIIQSSERKKVAKNLQSSVISILSDLGLGNAKFEIEFEEVNASSEGKDKINFLFSANPDQKLAPISKVISGGEMSRFLLAIKSSISKKPNTFFLDEIDNGLSGKSLFSLVELIKVISSEKQVLCITHQPFLASVGKTHFKVKKSVSNGSTFTSIKKLTSKKERQHEITDLIGGDFGEVNNYASILLKKAAA